MDLHRNFITLEACWGKTLGTYKENKSVPQLQFVHSLELHYCFLDWHSPLVDHYPDIPRIPYPKNYKMTFHSLKHFSIKFCIVSK